MSHSILNMLKNSDIPAGQLLTAKEVAAILNVVPRYPLILAQQGKLPCVRIASKCVRFRAEDVQALIDSNLDNGKEAA